MSYSNWVGHIQTEKAIFKLSRSNPNWVGHIQPEYTIPLKMGNISLKPTFEEFSWLLLTYSNIFFSGIMLQVWLTKDGMYHEEQFPSLKHRANQKRESREERKQRKYRYLYQVSNQVIVVNLNFQISPLFQVRTCHGDVISQPISNKYVTQIDESQA